MFPLCRRFSRQVWMIAAAVLVSPAAQATPNQLPLARATGIGVMTLAYGPQVALAPTIAAGSQTVVVSDSATVAAMHAANAALTVLYYINPNLAYYYPWYAEAQNTETTFLHAGDPAYAGATSAPGAVSLSWLTDSRGALGIFTISGYNVYRRKGSAGGWQWLVTTAPAVTSLTDTGLQNGIAYSYKITTVDTNNKEHTYSSVLPISPGSTAIPALVPAGLTVTQPDTLSALTTITMAASASITALDLWFDVNHNRIYDGSERFPMTQSGVNAAGLQVWAATVTTAEPRQPWGIAGHQWYVQTTAGSAVTVRSPQSGYNSSDPNNRIRAWDWGTWIMDISDTTWTRLVVNAAKGMMGDGADGLFIDVGVTTPLLLTPDATPARTVIAHYRTDMQSLMAQIKGAAGAGPVLFNGLDTSALTYLDVTDGAMVEGFVAQAWSSTGATGGSWWGGILDSELRAQAGRTTTIFNFGVGVDTTVAVRMYALASHLLVSNSHTFYYYANFAPAYFPEFDIAVGAPTQSFTRIADAKRPSGVYGRDFTGGQVLVNPSDTETLTEQLSAPMFQVTPSGGMVPSFAGSGTLSAQQVTSVTLPPHSGAVLLSTWSGQTPMPAFAPGSPDSAGWAGSQGLGTTRNSVAPVTEMLLLGPNPARTHLALRATLAHAGEVHAILLDARGRAVAEVARQHAAAGEWDASIDLEQCGVASGVYLLRVETPGTALVRRIVVARARQL